MLFFGKKKKKKAPLDPYKQLIHDYSEAIRAYDSGNHRKALELFRDTASKGYGDSYVRLGEEHEKGTVLPQSYDLALENYIKAVECDTTPFAFEKIIALYRNKNFSGHSEEKAFYYLQKGSEYELKNNQFLLGFTFDLGLHYYSLGQKIKAEELFNISLKPVPAPDGFGFSSHTYFPKADVLKAKMKAHGIDFHLMMLEYLAEFRFYEDDYALVKLVNYYLTNWNQEKFQHYLDLGKQWPEVHYEVIKVLLDILMLGRGTDFTVHLVTCAYLTLDKKCYEHSMTYEGIQKKYSTEYNELIELFHSDYNAYMGKIVELYVDSMKDSIRHAVKEMTKDQ